MKKIGFQGIKGAYSELAIYKYFGKDVNPVGFEVFEDAIDALEREEIDLAVLPIENSIAGPVTIVYDLLFKHNVHIIGEIYLLIKHNLLGIKGSSIKDLKTVRSHWQALMQCRKYLMDNGLKPVQTYDTAGSAKFVYEINDISVGAIASELAAERYGLEILERDISDNGENFTRFFVVSRTKKEFNHDNFVKTSIAFKAKHKSGSLVDALAILSKHNVNMTKIQSRPIPERPWEYVFYVDFESGSRINGADKLFEELIEHTSEIKVLGTYEEGKKV